MLTTHMLVKNNEETINQTLESLLPLNCEIIIGDTGCTDNTIKICKKFNLQIQKVFTKNKSDARNTIVNNTKTKWQFYINPGEVLISGHEEILKTIETDSQDNYFGNILCNNVLTKEVRLWQKGRIFKNPIYESIEGESCYLNFTIYKEGIDNYTLNQIDEWKKADPLNMEPYYYQSCIYLNQRKYKEFLSVSDYYLFKNTDSIQAVILRYYIAIVQCYINNDLESAIKNTIFCLSKNILMAEFWCLLGDIFLKNKEFNKSIDFYENAFLLGNRRIQSDRWPMDITKYEEYPKEMINKCQKTLIEIKEGITKTPIR